MLTAVEPAFAYIDPGTGSVLASAILGVFAALSYTARLQFHRIRNFFAGRARSATAETADDRG